MEAAAEVAQAVTLAGCCWPIRKRTVRTAAKSLLDAELPLDLL